MPLLREPLPNRWHVFGLRESPYFQDTLGEGDHVRPLSLFVGRARELDELLATIGGQRSSRQALGGAPGVGKTTLVQAAKAHAVEAGYWATDDCIPLLPEDTTERLLGRILGAIYDAVVTRRPQADGPVLRTARQYVRAFRLGGGGLSVGTPALSVGATASAAASTPGNLLYEGPRLVRDLLAFVRATGEAHGIVLHLNNLENLGERDLANAADVLRSLRDVALMLDGLHVLLVGTDETVQNVVGRHPQIRSVFRITSLGPLPLADVEMLLARRYTYLALSSKRPPVPPVARAAVAAFYPLFRGDLRGFLKALEEGVTLLAGLSATPGTTLTTKDLAPALRERYGARARRELTAKRYAQLGQWVDGHGTVPKTQRELQRLWRLRSQASVSEALDDLIAAGWIAQAAPRGRGAGTYVLAGPARLAFG